MRSKFLHYLILLLTGNMLHASIIFMDEIESIGSARMLSGGGISGDSEVQRIMLELLNQLDGFEASNKIKALMVTNWMHILDQALLRLGCMDRKIEFLNPNENISGAGFRSMLIF